LPFDGQGWLRRNSDFAVEERVSLFVGSLEEELAALWQWYSPVFRLVWQPFLSSPPP
jgi:hypothetical protein